MIIIAINHATTVYEYKSVYIPIYYITYNNIQLDDNKCYGMN